MKKLIYGTLAFAPAFAFAQTGLSAITKIVQDAQAILKILIPMAFGLAILYFFYGIAKYILSAGDEGEAQKGKSIMIYGVIAIAVMSSVWGLTAWLQNIFGINTIAQPNPTSIPTVTGL